MAGASLTPVDSAEYLEALERAATDAAKSAGGFQDHYHRVAGLTVRLQFAGTALVPAMTRALTHISVPPMPDPQLTISIWGSEPVGFFETHDESLTVVDAGRDRAWYWVNPAAGRLVPDRAAPLSAILRSWLALHEIQLVHAAAVGTAEGCVLIVGGRGAGKSTAALACIAAGLGCVGDDTCLIGPQEPPIVSSLYNTAQAGIAALEQHPFLNGGSLAGGAAGKAIGFLQDGVMLHEAPLRAVAVASVSAHRESRLGPASAREALAAVAPTSILRMPGPAQATLSRLARVIERAPCHHLEVGTDADGIARAVKALL